MNIFRSAEAAFRAGDSASFVGPAQTRLLGSSQEGTPVHVYHVQFESGARTNWHRHSGAQWLLITEGRVRVQVEVFRHESAQFSGPELFGPAMSGRNVNVSRRQAEVLLPWKLANTTPVSTNNHF